MDLRAVVRGIVRGADTYQDLAKDLAELLNRECSGKSFSDIRWSLSDIRVNGGSITFNRSGCGKDDGYLCHNCHKITKWTSVIFKESLTPLQLLEIIKANQIALESIMETQTRIEAKLNLLLSETSEYTYNPT